MTQPAIQGPLAPRDVAITPGGSPEASDVPAPAAPAIDSIVVGTVPSLRGDQGIHGGSPHAHLPPGTGAVHAPVDMASVEATKRLVSEQQKAVATKHGQPIARGFHNTQIYGGQAVVEVRPDAPPDLVSALNFQSQKPMNAFIRLSHGSHEPTQSSRGGTTGVGLAVALPNGQRQDFLGFSMPRFMKDVGEVRTVMEIQASIASFWPESLRSLIFAVKLIAKVGWTRGKDLISFLKEARGQRTDSLATQTYWSGGGLGLSKGGKEVVVRYELRPVRAPARDRASDAKAADPDYLRHDLDARLERGEPVEWTLGVKKWVSEEKTPINDASRPWKDEDSPFIPLATVRLVRPDPTRGPELEKAIDATSFSPANTGEGVRPVGIDVARGFVYDHSSGNRGGHNGLPSVH